MGLWGGKVYGASLLNPISIGWGNFGAELEESWLRDFEVLWKTKIPSKTQLFGWKLLQNKLPIIGELARRGILNGSYYEVYPMWFGLNESIIHILEVSFSR